MMPTIAELKALATPQKTPRDVFEKNLAASITAEAKIGRTSVIVVGLNDYPETRAALEAEGYTLDMWRNENIATVIWG